MTWNKMLRKLGGTWDNDHTEPSQLITAPYAGNCYVDDAIGAVITISLKRTTTQK